MANRAKAETCSLTEETNMKCVHERNPVDEEKQNMNDGAKGKWQIGRRASGRLAEGQVANRPKA